MTIKNKKRITLTIDSNCINAKESCPYMKKIEELAKRGQIKIYITSIMETEFLKGKGYKQGIDKSKNYSADTEVGVWGHSRWGSALYEDKDDSNNLEKIKKILFPKIEILTDRQIKDCMHLQTTIKYNREYFITNDKNFLKKKETIKEKLGAKIYSPEEFCKIILNSKK